MSKIALYWIDPDSPDDNFPPVADALTQPDGLLCFGGDLGTDRILNAYKRGIFPWYSEGQPIMWWSPSPRCVIYPNELIIRRSLKKMMRNAGYYFSIDKAFPDVIRACSAPRDEEGGTWITRDIQNAFTRLHELGHAHSAEVWKNGKLIGGLYGIAIGRVFFGESMFAVERDASKIALVCMTDFLLTHQFQLIDAQVTSGHLLSLGAREIERKLFISILDKYCHIENDIDLWQTDPMPVKEYKFNNE
jgi:leucyl/phenylalanyl-tRNA--protein transferase